jgi:Tol biopolymer transport system component
VDDNSLMHNISVLRKTLGTAPDGKAYIETAPRRGYRFIGTVRIVGNGIAGAGEPGPRVEFRRMPASAAGLLILMTAAGAFWMKSQPGPAPPLRITPLTSYPGTEAFPTFSPDGRQVAFAWNGEKQDQFDIYVKTIGEEGPRRLTSDVEPEYHMQWSPDGAWIGFVQGPPAALDGSGMAGGGLYFIPSGGGPKREIGHIHDGITPTVRPFTWAADGKSLISIKALGGTAEAGLFVLSLESDAPWHQLTDPPSGGWDSDPAVSPDGRTLAFVRSMAHGVSDIYLLRLDQQLAPQGRARRLTFENDFVSSLLWTNDGADLLYSRGHEGSRGVWRVRAEPGAVSKQVAALTQAGIHMALSRQGKLAFSHRYWDYDIWRAQLDGIARSAKPEVLIASTFSDAEPKYSLDGKSIAFQSNRSGDMEIWRSNADGGGATQLTFLHGEAGSPTWSPDSNEIAFDCGFKGNVDIYVVSSRGGKLRRLTSDPGVHVTPAWSRNGKWIYFASKRTGRLEVWRVPAEGGDATQVTRTGGFLASESADGKYLIYAKTGEYPTALWRLSLETGKEEELIHSLRNWFGFAVFGDGIYFIPEGNPGEKLPSFPLSFYDFSKGRADTVTEIDKPLGVGFAISPDRRSMLFAPSVMHGADLMLVENFR